MGKIYVTPEQMDASARNVQNYADQWWTAVTNIKQYVEELNAMWDGKASEGFRATFAQDAAYFVKLSELLTEYYTAINTAAIYYAEGEKEIYSIVTSR
ncbi:MAG: WXG100 family type VII secretion target [Firmicutes bacterium]|nr:WXG100 family type VII secretion target [Bacillota bacterium]